MGRKKLPPNVYIGSTKPGDRYGRVVIIKFLRRKFFPNGASDTVWEGRCNCGRVQEFTLNHLRTSHTRSCICLARETRARLNFKHGMRHSSPIYNIWKLIRSRCFSETNTQWSRYGGRGITLCKRWLDFDKFHQDLISEYKPGLSLDRINNNGNYSPENCRWATVTQQANNRSDNRKITINGETKNLHQWLPSFGISAQTFYYRVRKGLTDEEALLKKRTRL